MLFSYNTLSDRCTWLRPVPHFPYAFPCIPSQNLLLLGVPPFHISLLSVSNQIPSLCNRSRESLHLSERPCHHQTIIYPARSRFWTLTPPCNATALSTSQITSQLIRRLLQKYVTFPLCCHHFTWSAPIPFTLRQTYILHFIWFH